MVFYAAAAYWKPVNDILRAIALYQKHGFAITENYGRYIGAGNSVCMRKDPL